MVWDGVWSYDVDGTELNDHVNYVCMVPELQSLQPRSIIMADIDGDYPVFIRSQPQSGSLTILIAMKNASIQDWDTRLTALHALFDQTTYHTLTVKVRGMPEKKQVRFLVENLQPDFKSRTVVVSATAPNPNLVSV